MNLYVYQINDNDGQQVLANSEKEARDYVEAHYMDKGDTLFLEYMGSNYCPERDDHIEVAEW